MMIGIDLGTTNSAVAIWERGEARLIRNSLGEILTPSAVSVDPDGMVHVGASALDRMITDPASTAISFKRMMGTPRDIYLGKKTYKAEELSALVLRSLCDDVRAYSGETPREAVITVPAYFNDRQRKATRRAGELAGLNVHRLINEPTAAALAFGLKERGDREPFLVFDLGGGTFDVSIVEMFDGIVEVRASAGDNRLGGDDFNMALIQMAQGRLDPGQHLATLKPEKRDALLMHAAEQARRRLTQGSPAEFALTVEDIRLSTNIDEAEFETACEDLLRRLRDPVIRSLRDCGLESGHLSEIVLVGGATRMPIVRRAITRMFGRFPDSSVHPDHAVALGAAIQAGLLAKDQALDEIRITDVCPFTLGIETSHPNKDGSRQYGLFSPIINRNTPVPVSRMGNYSTAVDNQKSMQINIFQGEARTIAGNIQLGELTIPVPPRPAGEVDAEVRFSYDSSGLLEVDVSVPATGVTRNLVIVDEEDRATREDLESRREALAKLKFHPRDAAENVALMARAERLYEEFLGDQRTIINNGINRFEEALRSQDSRAITEARAALLAILKPLDHSPIL